MSLSNYRVGAAIAISDMNRAREFYEGKLGFAAATDDLPNRHGAHHRPTSGGDSNVAAPPALVMLGV